jgi:hypothetical protein
MTREIELLILPQSFFTIVYLYFLNPKYNHMVVLQIEHPVPDYNGWKKVFDSDPVGRERSGVKRYKIYRQTDNPNYVIVDLEFENIDEARNVHTALQQVWKQVEGKVITGPKARIMEMVENKEY